jgi:hypothetical protein
MSLLLQRKKDIDELISLYLKKDLRAFFEIFLDTILSLRLKKF